jgi:uncharacterized protein (DUF58 family)
VKNERLQIRTTWKSNWLIELSLVFIILGLLTREPVLATVGIVVSLTLGVLGLRFYRHMTGTRGRLHVEPQLPRNRIFLGETAEGTLKVRNESTTDINLRMIHASLDESLRLRFQRAFNELVRVGGEATFPFTVAPLNRGRHQIAGFSLVLMDSRYLFTTEMRFGEPEWLEVLPGTSQPLTPLTLYSGSPERARRTSIGFDYAGIREYTPGDEYHRVEWKATARLRQLMVKEFHPETQTNLKILIDTGRTMRQQSYVGTRLDEALAVAQLLAQAGTTSDTTVGVYFYDETRLVKALSSAAGDEQLAALRNFTPTSKPSTRPGATSSFSKPLGIMRSMLPQGGQLIAYLQLLKRVMGQGYQNAGVYKAIREATSAGRESVLVVLTDLESNVDALLEAASTYKERAAKIIVPQIGATWRLSLNLEQGYTEHQRNLSTLHNLQTEGLTAIDVRPEQLLETISNFLGSNLTITSTGSRT